METLRDQYDDLVEYDEMTCFACPTQYEGKLKDGRYFYFRYRHGYASLRLGTCAVAAVSGVSGETGMRIGDGLDGLLNNNEYRETFMRLYRKLGADA